MVYGTIPRTYKSAGGGMTPELLIALCVTGIVTFVCLGIAEILAVEDARNRKG